MTAVTNGTSSTMSLGGESEHDLVPAGLIKARDGMPVISPHYSKVSEHLRKSVPHEMACSMFCGGRRCKYESGDHWSPEQMAIPGLYSHWVTENLLAMARPNAKMMEKGQLLEHFKAQGIKSVINLQTPGEHASCGPKLKRSGFSYDPNELMKNGIFFYNFAWKDYGDAPMSSLLDMVKVVSFATSEGKVAVHCHAGLGRTGVLLACYLVYYLRVRSNDALRYVRLKRPGAVQTRKQIDCVKEFEAYFLPQCLVFSLKPVGDPDKRSGRFTVDQHLKRQKSVIHGFEARTLKYIPKVLFRLCERLLQLCDCGPTYEPDQENFTKSFFVYRFDDKASKLLTFKDPNLMQLTPSDSMVVTRRSSRSMLISTDDDSSTGMSSPGSRPGSETSSYIQSCSSALSGVDDKKLDDILADGIRNQPLSENQVTQELESHADHQKAVQSETLPKYSAKDVYEALLDTHGERIRSEEGMWATDNTTLFKQYKTDLNVKLSAWDRIESETNLFVLSALLFEWLEHLKSPVVDKDSITYIVIHCDNLDEALKRLPNPVCYILEYLVRFVVRLQPLERDESEKLMRRFMASLTHQSVIINNVTHPSGRKFPKLRGGTADSTKKFMMKMFDFILTSGPSFGLMADTFGSNSLEVSSFSTTTSLGLNASEYRPKAAPVEASTSRLEQSSPSSSTHSVNAEVHQAMGDKNEDNNMMDIDDNEVLDAIKAELDSNTN